MVPPQTGHFIRRPAWSLRATSTWPQEQTSSCEPAGMRMALPFAGTRARIFSRVLGSTAQRTLNFAEQDGQVCSRLTPSEATETLAPQEQRTEPASLFTPSAMASHVDLVPLLGLRVVALQFPLQMLECLLGAVADLEEVQVLRAH